MNTWPNLSTMPPRVQKIGVWSHNICRWPLNGHAPYGFGVDLPFLTWILHTLHNKIIPRSPATATASKAGRKSIIEPSLRFTSTSILFGVCFTNIKVKSAGLDFFFQFMYTNYWSIHLQAHDTIINYLQNSLCFLLKFVEQLVNNISIQSPKARQTKTADLNEIWKYNNQSFFELLICVRRWKIINISPFKLFSNFWFF